MIAFETDFRIEFSLLLTQLGHPRPPKIGYQKSLGGTPIPSKSNKIPTWPKTDLKMHLAPLLNRKMGPTWPQHSSLDGPRGPPRQEKSISRDKKGFCHINFFSPQNVGVGGMGVSH